MNAEENLEFINQKIESLKKLVGGLSEEQLEKMKETLKIVPDNLADLQERFDEEIEEHNFIKNSLSELFSSLVKDGHKATAIITALCEYCGLMLGANLVHADGIEPVLSCIRQAAEHSQKQRQKNFENN